MMKKLISTLFFAAIVQACNSTTDTSQLAEQCNPDNWADVGYQAAVAGKSVRTFDRYIEQCSDQLDSNAKKYYVAGYSKGLTDYCTFDSGYNKALKQGSLELKETTICPLEKRSEFQNGFNQGRMAYEQQVQTLEKMKRRQEYDHAQNKRKFDEQNRAAGG